MNKVYEAITKSFQIRCGTTHITIDHIDGKFKRIHMKRGRTGKCSMNLASKMCHFISRTTRHGDINKVIKELREDGEQCQDGSDGTKQSCTQAIADILEQWRDGKLLEKELV